MTTIIVTHEDNEIDEFEFEPDDRVVSIGRRSTNDVCIPNLSVSGMHARITIDGDTVSIEDNNSTNGTYVNGRLISRQLLNKNDEIVIGKTRVVVQLNNDEFVSRNNRSAAHSEPPVLSAVSDYEEDEDADDSYIGDTKRTGNDHTGNDQLFDERPMSLSEKAKLALNGRQSHTDSAGPRTALNGVSKNTFGTVPASTSSSLNDRAFPDDEVAVAEAPPISDSRSRMQAVVQKQSAANSIEPHPLDGLDGQLDGQLDDQLHNNISEPKTSQTASIADDSLANPSVKKLSGAVIEIQNGAKSGQVLPIDKPVTTLGRPGIQIAAIMRKPDGYFLMHIESDDCVDMPTLNRDSIGDDPVMLNSGDKLNVAGIDVEFMLS